MPSAYTYPGVYIEEVPSGVRTIAGVSTSVAAFIGWACKGPTKQATRVLSFSDFTRWLGGLHARSPLGYAVQHFFDNGGQEAHVIRLAADNATAASLTIDGKLSVKANSPGEWAKAYKIETSRRADDPTRFRLTVLYAPADQPPTAVESFENLSIAETDRRFVKTVVDAGSAFVEVDLVGTPTSPPADTTPTAFTTSGTDGDVLEPDTAAFETKLAPSSKAGGVYLLDRVDIFNLLCVPGETTATEIAKLQAYCHEKRAFLIVDAPRDTSFANMQKGPDAALLATPAINSALYFPWVVAADSLQENRLREFPPCGFVAGIYARTDSSRGVWTAPAGTEARLVGAAGVEPEGLTDRENGTLNSVAVNCIRTFWTYGTVLWGSRTLHGADARASEWKYVPVRRLALCIEESLYRGTQWVVFEPNDEPLWAQIRLNVGAFMHDLFRQGAFQGTTPRDAYFVKCDRDTTTQSDINRGVVNIEVGFAPLKPAEFVVIRIQQRAGQVQA